MRINAQLRFMASNILAEVADAVDDFRNGVVPEVRVEADAMLDRVEAEVDKALRTVHTAVSELKEQVVVTN